MRIEHTSYLVLGEGFAWVRWHLVLYNLMQYILSVVSSMTHFGAEIFLVFSGDVLSISIITKVRNVLVFVLIPFIFLGPISSNIEFFPLLNVRHTNYWVALLIVPLVVQVLALLVSFFSIFIVYHHMTKLLGGHHLIVKCLRQILWFLLRIYTWIKLSICFRSEPLIKE